MYNITNIYTNTVEGITNIDTYEKLHTVNKDENTPVLINVHLNWNRQKLSNNYGFAIANELRTKLKSKAPIVLYSPLPLSYFELKAKTDIKYKILFGRGTAFLEAPFSMQELKDTLKNIRVLSNSSLHDVATMLCNLKGVVIDKLNHDLKPDSNINKIMDEVQNYLSDIQKSALQWDAFKSLLNKAIKENNIEAFYTEKHNFITICNRQLTEEGNNNIAQKGIKYTVLFLDDVQEELDKIQIYLSDSFDVITTTSALKAKDIIEKDIKQDILAIVADWRLFNDASQYWQPLQGYEVLEYASKNSFRTLFALTSQADFIVHQIRNIQNIRFSLFKKENLKTEEQYRVFADVLYEACLQSLQLRSSMPTSKQWTNIINGTSYKQLYLEQWNADNKEEFFAQVESKADEIWEYIMHHYNDNIKNIGLLKEEFNIEIPKKELNIFPILVLRRIWMALWYLRVTNLNIKDRNYLNETLNWVYQVVCTGMYSKYDGNNANVEQNKLSLKSNEILDKQMLPEERHWILKHKLLE